MGTVAVGGGLWLGRFGGVSRVAECGKSTIRASSKLELPSKIEHGKSLDLFLLCPAATETLLVLVGGQATLIGWLDRTAEQLAMRLRQWHVDGRVRTQPKSMADVWLQLPCGTLQQLLFPSDGASVMKHNRCNRRSFLTASSGALAAVPAAVCCRSSQAAEAHGLSGGTSAAEWDHQQDVVYGYKDGMALVMDVFTPKDSQNGGAVIRLMSGGMRSSPTWSHRATNDRPEVRRLLKAGYVVFAVAHGCQPRYTLDEAQRDIARSVRFIRHNASRFGIDPQRIGIMGASSGGHLSLLAATAPPAPSPDTRDLVDRESSRVQAVVAYFAGTDNLNFGAQGTTISDHFRALGQPTNEFNFHDQDEKSGRRERITDPEKIRERFRATSPITHVSAATAPVLLLHGAADQLVPLQQSEVFVSRLKKAGVPHRLIVYPCVGHGYSNGWETSMPGEIEAILDWFDQHLLGNGR